MAKASPKEEGVADNFLERLQQRLEPPKPDSVYNNKELAGSKEQHLRDMMFGGRAASLSEEESCLESEDSGSKILQMLAERRRQALQQKPPSPLDSSALSQERTSLEEKFRFKSKPL